jgi:hypothetical protein
MINVSRIVSERCMVSSMLSVYGDCQTAAICLSFVIV